MKKLTGLIIILAVLVLGGFYGMGILTERTIKKNVEVINQTNGLFVAVENYNRGWFCSDAKLNWRLHVPEHSVKGADGKSQTVAAQDYNMTVPLKIHHGPIIYADKSLRFGLGYAETILVFPEQYNQKFDEMFSKDSMKPQLDLSIFVNYLNHSTVELMLPTFKLLSKDGTGKLDWIGMKTTFSLSQNLDKVKGEVLIDGMNIVKDDSKITLGKVTSDYDLHKTSTGLYLGEGSITVPSLEILVKDQKIFGISDFSINSTSDIQNNLFSTHLNVELDSVIANAKTYGPGQLEVSLRNLDADVLAKINEKVNAMQKGSDTERQQAMLGLLPELPKLFSKGAEFEISKLNFKLPQGTIDGHMLISLPKGDSSNPFELLQKVQGSAKIKVPAAMVKQVMQQSLMQQMANQADMRQKLMQQLQSNLPQANPAPTTEQLVVMQTDKQLAAMEQTGLITVSGSDYVMEVTLTQGKFTVNKKPFDPSMLKF